jgi:DNA-directed RNA polymerase subunit RPC12/RpoP
MNKIKVRVVKGFGTVGGLHNVEVVRPLSGFGYSKKLYCCSNCGELFVHDLDDPALHGINELPKDLTGDCPQCSVSLKEHLLPYPDYVFLPSGVTTQFDGATVLYDHENSLVEEYCLID